MKNKMIAIAQKSVANVYARSVQFHRGQRGAGLVEWLIIGLAAAALIVVIYSVVKGELPGFIKKIFDKSNELN
ncbi:hypothetical protein FGY93_25160 (plasmid) [Paenibacillus polymyxa]|nr:hypothetical protein FGY93_25160 [Paenibacillus polymyxa]